MNMPETSKHNSVIIFKNNGVLQNLDLNQTNVNQENFEIYQQHLTPKIKSKIMVKPFAIRGTTKKIVEIITKESIQENGFRFIDMTPSFSNNSSLNHHRLNISSQLNVNKHKVETESDNSSTSTDSNNVNESYDDNKSVKKEEYLISRNDNDKKEQEIESNNFKSNKEKGKSNNENENSQLGKLKRVRN
jgi:hypothetical protein